MPDTTFLDATELVINMGPQHPATHGVLRVILKLDGEKVLGAVRDSGGATTSSTRSMPSPFTSLARSQNTLQGSFQSTIACITATSSGKAG